MKKPNFFIIGARKCGTTSIAKYLKDHPDIFMSEPKELIYFSREELRETMNMWHLPKMTLDDYLDYFSDVRDEKIVGEASVSYLTTESSIKKILFFNPDARFLVIFRNPIDAAQSLHKDLIRKGCETVLDFESAWRLQSSRRQGRDLPFKCLSPKLLMYKEMCLWGEQLGRVLSVVDRQMIHMMLFEDFMADPRGEYCKILEFLGVKDDGRTDFSRENPSRIYKSMPIVNVLDIIDLSARILKSRLGINKSLKVGRFMTAFKRSMETPVVKQMLSDEFLEEISEEFRRDILFLSNLMGRDLSFWLDRPVNRF